MITLSHDPDPTLPSSTFTHIHQGFATVLPKFCRRFANILPAICRYLQFGSVQWYIFRQILKFLI